MSSVIPQSPPGGIHPELRAAITAAANAVAEYTTETDAWIAGKAERPYWESWAWRLHTELRFLLKAIADSQDGVTPLPPGGQAEQ